VATPVHWDELALVRHPDQYTIKKLLRRLTSMKRDPWPDYFQLNQSLPTFV
jgi:bifunctional non-homologous end joining protein LigD